MKMRGSLVLGGMDGFLETVEGEEV